MGHAEDFVHAWGDSINGGSATNLIIELGGEFLAASNDLFAFFAVGIPGVFGFGAGVLAEGGKRDLGEAIFDDFVAWLKLVFFPEAELASGLLDSGGNLGYLFIG